MLDKIILEDIELIKSGVNGAEFDGKNVLVTGGAGFLGSWLCDVLVDFGAKVTCLDDFSTGREININHLHGNSAFQILKQDACSFQSKEKFDFIFHLAGHASPEEYLTHPIETLQASSFGTANMAELARRNDSVLLFASTSEVYGDAEIIPTPESYWGKVNPVGPRSCYDEGKRFSEALLVAYCKQHGLKVRLPRIFNSYGPRLREDGLYGRAVSRFIMQALSNQPITIYGDGQQTRSFCYVTDTITGLLQVASCDELNGEPTNLGNPMELSILELANNIKKISESKSFIEFHPLPKDDPRRRCPNTEKLEKNTTWKPRISFEKGLKRTITWFS